MGVAALEVVLAVNISDLIALLLLWVLFRIVRGALTAARRPSQGGSGPQQPPESAPESQQMRPPPPPETGARRRRREAERQYESDTPDVAAPEIGDALSDSRHRGAVSSREQRRAARTERAPARKREDLGGLDKVLRESPLIGGLILREVLDEPRSRSPHPVSFRRPYARHDRASR